MLDLAQKIIYPITIPYYFFLGLVKFMAMIILILIFIIQHEFFHLFFVPTNFFLKSISLYCSLALKVLNIQIQHNKNPKIPGARLIICNHLSYLDIMILFAYYPSLFITSNENKETPVLGHLAKLAKCFFIERRKEKRQPETVANEINLIKRKLNDGFNVFLFPEGTTSNGSQVLPFKLAFFQTAIDCQKEILPLCIKYTSINDEPFQNKNANLVCWYGEMTFIDHLFKVSQLREIIVTLNELSPVDSKNFTNKTELGSFCYQNVSDFYSKNRKNY